MFKQGLEEEVEEKREWVERLIKISNDESYKIIPPKEGNWMG